MNEIMNEQEFFQQKALSGYIVCFADQCPMHEDCLRWKVGQHQPTNVSTCLCVSPRYEKALTQDCDLYQCAHKLRFAKGMTQIFTDDMPQKVENYVRTELVKKHNRTYFFEYRNGTRLISPEMQEEIRNLFRRAGWQQEVHFDEYVEAYM